MLHNDEIEVYRVRSKSLVKLPEDSIGKKIYKFRLSLGIMQKDFAKKAGFCVGTIIKWENGKIIPYVKSLKQLCDAFGLDSDYFDN